MKLRLTDLAVKKLSLPKRGQVSHWDETTPGFGVRCSSKSKSWIVMYGEKRRLKTLGRFPDVSLSDARKQAKLFLSTKALTPEKSTSHDFRTVVLAYLSDCEERLRPKTLEGYNTYLNAIIFDGAIEEVTQSQILKKIKEYTDSPSSQNYAFTTFKVFLNWAVRNQYVVVNPIQAFKKPHKAKSRERILKDKELTTLLAYTLGKSDRFCDIVTLLIMTGQRRGEIANLEWSEVDSETITLPAHRTKNGREHTIPLNNRTIEFLNSIEGGSRYVFGTNELDVPFSGWSRAQRRLLSETGLSHFTLHDLRRTFATIHARMGTPVHVTEKLLNHVSGTISGVAAVYNRHSYMEEMRAAAAAYEAFLESLLDS